MNCVKRSVTPSLFGGCRVALPDPTVHLSAGYTQYYKFGVVEGSKVRRRAKSVSNAIRAPKSVPNTPQSVFSTPRGRDVLLYPDRATFYNPVGGRAFRAKQREDKKELGVGL